MGSTERERRNKRLQAAREGRAAMRYVLSLAGLEALAEPVKRQALFFRPWEA